MTVRDTPLNLTEALLAGPRGRRLLLEYAQIADEHARTDHTQDSFYSGVFYAAYQLDVGNGTSRVIYGPGADQPLPNIPPEEVARRLADVALPAATEKDLRTVLAATTDSARYWQEPSARRQIVPANADVFEIDVADDWAELCRWFPLEVAAQNATTGTAQSAATDGGFCPTGMPPPRSTRECI